MNPKPYGREKHVKVYGAKGRWGCGIWEVRAVLWSVAGDMRGRKE